MLAAGAVVSTPEEISDAVDAARSLLDSDKWLEKQSKLRPSDSLLQTDQNIFTQKQLIHYAAQDLEVMHPVAEAIIGGEIILAAHARTGKPYVGMFLLLLTSLRDVAKYQSRISGVAERVGRLKTPMWRATMYELLVACSLAQKTNVRLIEEGADPTPDIAVAEPELFFECKARSAPEENHLRLINGFRSKISGGIIKLSQQVEFGMHVLIEVHDEKVIDNLVGMIAEMCRRHKSVLATSEVYIKIFYYDGVSRKTSRPMPLMSKDLWMEIMEFQEFDKWHYILPGGDFKFSNFSHFLVAEYKKPVLICMRSTTLGKASANIRNTIKIACKRQLRGYRPGVVRMLINTSLYSVLSTLEEVMAELEFHAHKILDEYEGRLVAIYFDVVRYSPLAGMEVVSGSVSVFKPGFSSFIKDLQPVVLI